MFTKEEIMSDESRVIEHIKLIQPIITRMSSSSFTIKGFALTSQTLLLGFAYKDSVWQLNVLLQLIMIILCMTDMFYLWQERLFRTLYDDVRVSEKTEFSMSTKVIREKVKYRKALSSVSIWPFYLGLLIINISAVVLEVLPCVN